MSLLDNFNQPIPPRPPNRSAVILQALKSIVMFPPSAMLISIASLVVSVFAYKANKDQALSSKESAEAAWRALAVVEKKEGIRDEPDLAFGMKFFSVVGEDSEITVENFSEFGATELEIYSIVHHCHGEDGSYSASRGFPNYKLTDIGPYEIKKFKVPAQALGFEMMKGNPHPFNVYELRLEYRRKYDNKLYQRATLQMVNDRGKLTMLQILDDWPQFKDAIKKFREKKHALDGKHSIEIRKELRSTLYDN